MTAPVQIAEVVTWPQAIVAVVVILAAVVWPGVLSWLNSKASRHTSQAIKTTLTENNGGGSVKDALDRIERRLAAVEKKLEDG